MKPYRIKSLVFVMAALFLSACAIQPPAQKPKPWASFTAKDLSSKLKSGEYTQKVNTFQIVLDASGSMLDDFGEKKKREIAKGVVWRLDQTIPNLKLTGGLRTLGQADTNSSLVYGMTSYSKGVISAALEGVYGGGSTPLGTALDKTGDDLKTAQGNSAVIVVSDGKETDDKSVAAAQKINAQHGDRVCIYTVLVGDDAEGKNLLGKISQAGGDCGFSTNADQVDSRDGMADFVEKVFLTRLPDADGDGVFDQFDKCPDTPKGVQVGANGCPLDSDEDGVFDQFDKCPDTPKDVVVDEYGCAPDSDRDGVLDYMDECLNTPEGATVDKRGCWAYEAILMFDINSDKINPDADPMLDEAVSVLQKNSEIRVEIQGHTCNLGSPEHNMKLSDKRAKAVSDYFINHGIATGRLTTIGFGLTRPAYPNNTDENRAKNRRVELKPIR